MSTLLELDYSIAIQKASSAVISTLEEERDAAHTNVIVLHATRRASPLAARTTHFLPPAARAASCSLQYATDVKNLKINHLRPRFFLLQIVWSTPSLSLT